MNTYRPAPSPLCATFALVLPLLDEAGPDDALANRARAHLRGCAHCQAERAQYARLDRVLRQHYAVASVARRPTEEIMSYIADQAAGAQQPAPVTSAPVATRHPRTPRRSWFSGVAAVGSVAALIALAVVLFAAHGNPGYGGPPRYAFPGTTGVFASLSMVSPTEGWALAQITKTPQGSQPLDQVTIYHYLDGTWTPVTVKTHTNFAIGGVSGFNGTISMDSPTDGWAVAHNFNQVSALLHYSNGAWTEVAAPYLETIQASGPRSLWAIGGEDFTGATLVHYDGTNWTSQTLPGVPATNSAIPATPAPAASASATAAPSGAIAATPTAAPSSGAIAATPTAAPSVSGAPASNSGGASGQPGRVIGFQMVSESTGWALLTDGNGRYAVARYANGAWSLATSSFSAGDVANFSAFTMVSPTEGWALGEKSVPDSHGITTHVPLQELVYHYLNGRWSSTPIPVDGSTYTTLRFISMRSPTDGWIAGSQQSVYPGATTSDFQQHPVLYHYTGGAWQAVRVPQTGTPVAGLTDLTFTADGKGWAVGYVSNIPASRVVQDTDILAQASPLVWTFDGTTWSMMHG